MTAPAPLTLKYTTLDVFTSTRYLGNPLAVVHVPAALRTSVSQETKQRIATEFNYSETTFVHDPDPTSTADGPSSDSPDEGEGERAFDIFTIEGELPFAGHPTIGTAVHVLTSEPGVRTLRAKSGPIHLRPQPQALGAGDKTLRVHAAIPHDVHIHARTLGDLHSGGAHNDKQVLDIGLSRDPEIRSAELAAPVVSIVRGMTFILVPLPSLEVLGRVTAELRLDFAQLPTLLDDGPWHDSFVCRYYYVPGGIKEDDTGRPVWTGRTRMVELSFEDPATGSAACTLASFLTLDGQAGTRQGVEAVGFEVTQGVEMGRKSDIELQVTPVYGSDGEVEGIKEVLLGGTAVEVMRGEIAI